MLKLVLDRQDKLWNWLSKNPTISIQDAIGNPGKPGDWCWLYKNSDITMQHVVNNPDKPRDWTQLSISRIYVLK